MFSDSEEISRLKTLWQCRRTACSSSFIREKPENSECYGMSNAHLKPQNSYWDYWRYKSPVTTARTI